MYGNVTFCKKIGETLKQSLLSALYLTDTILKMYPKTDNIYSHESQLTPFQKKNVIGSTAIVKVNVIRIPLILRRSQFKRFESVRYSAPDEVLKSFLNAKYFGTQYSS